MLAKTMQVYTIEVLLMLWDLVLLNGKFVLGENILKCAILDLIETKLISVPSNWKQLETNILV